MKIHFRFCFLFLITILYAFCVPFSSPGAAAGFDPNDLVVEEVTSPTQLPRTVELYRGQGYSLDEGTAWDNLRHAQVINLEYHCITASMPGDGSMIGVLEWSAYPRLFDGAPRIDLHIVAPEDERGQTTAEYLFQLATAMSQKYKGKLDKDVASRIRVSLNIKKADEGKAVDRALDKFKASAHTPYGFHASVEDLRRNFPSKPARTDVAFTQVHTPVELGDGYDAFSQLQPKLSKEQYVAGFNVDPAKLTVIHASKPDAPDTVIAMMAGAYRANLLGKAFDPDTIVVDEGSRRLGIGKDLLAQAAALCIEADCSIFVESGRARGVSKFYEDRGIPADSINYRWDLKDMGGIVEPVGAWASDTMGGLDIF